MKPERFQRIQALYEAALSKGAAERRAYLVASCGGDEALRRDVESLLELEEGAATFMELYPGPRAA